MYQILTNNGVLGYAEEPCLCYKLPSGSAQIIGCKEREHGATATGLVYGGKVYNLPCHDDFEVAETAWVTEVNAVTALNAQQRALMAQDRAAADIDDMTLDHEIRLMDLELGLGGDT